MIQLLSKFSDLPLTVIPFTTKGTKCYLEFEQTKSAADIIVSLVNTSNEVVIDNYGNPRYIGANPNNYVYFNCDDYNNPSSSTCELWRIIGVFSEDTHGISNTKLVKLIRSESVGEYMWYTTSSAFGSNDWTSSSLKESLNGSYLSGTNLGNGKGITSTANDMIEEIIWKLGGSNSYDDVTASMFYERERGTTVYDGRPTTWMGKVGLMYPSDYGYATSGGVTTNRTSCLAIELSNWSSLSDCYNNDWLYDNSTIQWTLTHLSSGRMYVFHVHNTGVTGYHDALTRHSVRPSVYLKFNISISGGEGSSSNPYTLTAS